MQDFFDKTDIRTIRYTNIDIKKMHKIFNLPDTGTVTTHEEIMASYLFQLMETLD